MAYIKPPAGSACEWSRGSPPSVGWWPASVNRDPTVLRYWDGKCWSTWVSDYRTSIDAQYAAKRKSVLRGIKWCDRWWEVQDGQR